MHILRAFIISSRSKYKSWYQTFIEFDHVYYAYTYEQCTHYIHQYWNAELKLDLMESLSHQNSIRNSLKCHLEEGSLKEKYGIPIYEYVKSLNFWLYYSAYLISLAFRTSLLTLSSLIFTNSSTSSTSIL